MLPVRCFDGKPFRPDRKTFVSFTGGCHVRFLCAPQGVYKVFLHWFDDRSVPCLTSECPHCPEQPEPFGYAPVELLAPIGPDNWRSNGTGILCITSAAMALCEQDLRCTAVKVWRKGGHKRGEMQHRLEGRVRHAPPPSFNVAETLLPQWNRYLAADRKHLGERDADARAILDALAAAGREPNVVR